MRKIFLFVLGCFWFVFSFSQNIDVQHYEYDIVLSDQSDVMVGRATIKVKFLKESSRFNLDLVTVDKGKGMETAGVFENGLPVNFSHQNNKLSISTHAKAGEIKTYDIQYSGIPKDGLIISENRYGDRTFFADNWPNRAHHWIPCNDRPDDKASFEFIVTAPHNYNVISNGILKQEKDLSDGSRITHWKEEIPLPTKVMVIGVAKFAVKEYTDSQKNIPVTAWIFPQDSSKGFHDYSAAPGILKFFSDYIAPYPFQKLANVQSKTIFGGMENASAIFYAESSVTGKAEVEDLLAHEIAHQWFGDMASEKSFAHLWLSEGFATYLTNIYLEKKYGKEMMMKRMEEDRQQVIEFAKKNNNPVVDTASSLMSLLNANSYQKGAWVLHMLRNEVGDSVFQKIIQTYYQQFKGSNADSRDFEAVAEKVSGKELTWFFYQWLYQPGIPVLHIKYNQEGNELKLEIEQSNPIFKMKLPITLIDRNGNVSQRIIPIEGRETKFKLEGKGPFKINLDPDKTLLYSEKK